MHIIEIYTPDEAKDLLGAIKTLEFEDGKLTAGGSAKEVKNNQQASTTGPTEALIEQITNKLIANQRVQSSAFPNRFARVSINRYGVGDSYGVHVDAHHMDKVRTDLSFTLFLSDPSSYDGGELRMYNGSTQSNIKLTAGQIVIYPTRLRHEVLKVTRGERIAVIGWIESFIPDMELREIATSLTMAQEYLKTGEPISDVKTLLNEATNRFIRIASR